MFTYVSTESCFPIDFNITGSIFTTTALTVWWPSDRRFKAIPLWLNFFFFLLEALSKFYTVFGFIPTFS